MPFILLFRYLKRGAVKKGVKKRRKLIRKKNVGLKITSFIQVSNSPLSLTFLHRLENKRWQIMMQHFILSASKSSPASVTHLSFLSCQRRNDLKAFLSPKNERWACDIFTKIEINFALFLIRAFSRNITVFGVAFWTIFFFYHFTQHATLLFCCIRSSVRRRKLDKKVSSATPTRTYLDLLNFLYIGPCTRRSTQGRPNNSL